MEIKFTAEPVQAAKRSISRIAPSVALPSSAPASCSLVSLARGCGRRLWRAAPLRLPLSPARSRCAIGSMRAARRICQRVALDWVPCKPTRGGQWMFLCPTCGRRCRNLFSLIDRPFRCRECHGLAYRSWREGNQKRVLRRASQIGVLLEGAPADGVVPPSYRLRHSQRRMRMRARLREAMATLAFELLRDD
jgi:hypothetical protein